MKNTKFNNLKTKSSKLDKKTPDVATLIHINQHNIDQQNLEKKIADVDKKIRDLKGLLNTNVLDKKIGEVENKKPDFSGLVKETDYDAKIFEIEGKFITTSDYNKFMSEILDAKIKQTKISQQI